MFGKALAVGFCAVGALAGVSLIHRQRRRSQIARRLRVTGARGIEEERFIRIGGIDQWVSFRGEDRGNLVLLVAHGGPGMPTSVFATVTQPWERYFTVVQWDQRGAGKTLAFTGRKGTGELTFERLVRDGLEVADYVHARLPDRPIVLMGSSFGSLLALDMVRRRPGLFCAYVGSDFNVGMVHNFEARHRALIERLKAARLPTGAAALERVGADPTRWNARRYLKVAQWALKSDPTAHQRISKLFARSLWFSPGHSLRQIREYVYGAFFSPARLLPDIVASDAWSLGTRFTVPFFVFQGENDVVTPPGLAREFFDDVTAPVKEMVLLRGAAHLSAFTHPEQFLKELKQRESVAALLPAARNRP